MGFPAMLTARKKLGLALLISVSLAVPFSGAWAELQADARVGAAPADVIENFHEVSPGVYRGALPGPAGLAALKAFGIKTDLNLVNMGKAGMRDEERLAEALGLNYVHMPLASFRRPEDAEIEAILHVLADRNNYPVFIHCRHGNDRTGMVVGLYRVFIEKWKAQDAWREMIERGFHKSLWGLGCYFKKKTGLKYSKLCSLIPVADWDDVI